MCCRRVAVLQSTQGSCAGVRRESLVHSVYAYTKLFLVTFILLRYTKYVILHSRQLVNFKRKDCISHTVISGLNLFLSQMTIGGRQ